MNRTAFFTVLFAAFIAGAKAFAQKFSINPVTGLPDMVSVAVTQFPSASVTGTTTLGNTNYFVSADTTGGSYSVSLPPSPLTGQSHVIKKASVANTLTVDGNGHTIDGEATLTIVDQYTSATLIFNGTEWSIF